MFDATWNNEKLAGFKAHDLVAKVEIETPLQNEEQFVLGVVPMPNEFAFQLYEFDVLTIQLADDSRSPVI